MTGSGRSPPSGCPVFVIVGIGASGDLSDALAGAYRAARRYRSRCWSACSPSRRRGCRRGSSTVRTPTQIGAGAAERSPLGAPSRPALRRPADRALGARRTAPAKHPRRSSSAVAKQPRDSELHFLLGLAYLDAGRKAGRARACSRPRCSCLRETTRSASRSGGRARLSCDGRAQLPGGARLGRLRATATSAWRRSSRSCASGPPSSRAAAATRRSNAPRAREAHRARARRPSLRPGHGVPRAVRARRVGDVRRTGARGGDRDRHRRRRRARVRDRRERRDGQGRHVLPDHGQEAPPRTGDRRAEPPALPLPRRLRRRVPAAPGRGLPRPRPLRADLLQPGADVGAGHPADRRRHGLVHGGRRLRPGDERRDDHRQGHGHDLHRRAAAREGGHRRGGDRRGARRRGRPHAAVGRRRLLRRVSDEHALALCRQIVRNLGSATARPSRGT